jgi:hypothetical protein
MTPTDPLSIANPQQPSLAELMLHVLDDAGKLVKAEAQLLKDDLTTTLKLSELFLIVLTASGLLLALMLSLLLAALVLSLHGTPIQALLAAALGNGVVAAAAIGWLVMQIRKTSEKIAEDAAPVVHGAQSGSVAS